MAPDDEDNWFSVFCDQTTDGGGWLVFQKRTSPFTTLFSKNWKEYEEGFNHSINSFWLGNQYLSRLTKTPLQPRIELEDRQGLKGYAVYDNFSISGPEDNYRLSVGAYVEGTIGNAFHGESDKAFVEDGMQFTTVDRDNDRNSLGNCATVNGPSGWWLSNCGRANLNQAYIPQWDGWLYSSSIISTEMKIRWYNAHVDANINRVIKKCIYWHLMFCSSLSSTSLEPCLIPKVSKFGAIFVSLAGFS